MTNRSRVDHRVTVMLPAFGPDVPARVRGYVHELARWQTAEGMATVPRKTLAGGLGCSVRTVQRLHRDAERLGLVARVAGGRRGHTQTVRLLCTNPETATERETRRKATAGQARARRIRQARNDAARRGHDANARARHAQRDRAASDRLMRVLDAYDAGDLTAIPGLNRETQPTPLTTHGEAGAPHVTPRHYVPERLPAQTKDIPTPNDDWRRAYAARGQAIKRRLRVTGPQ